MEFRAQLFADPEQREQFSQARREIDAETAVTVLIPPSLPASNLGHLAGILGRGRYGLLLRPDWPLPWRRSLEQRLRTIPEDDLRQFAPNGGLFIATGGSTGQPRFALHTPQSLTTAANTALQYATRGAPMHVAITLPVDHVSGLMPFMRAQLSEGSILTVPWRQVPQAAAGRWLSLVPTQFAELVTMENGANALAEAAGIFLGGASLEDLPLGSLSGSPCPLHFTYGMTETAGMIAARPWDGMLPTSMAAPLLDGVEASIDEHSGQISIDYFGLAVALWPEFTPLTRPYHTGDAGEWESPGVLRVKGRLDRVIVSGGEKVDPSIVEAVLRELPGIKEARVMGQPDTRWGQSVTALCHAPGLTTDQWTSLAKDLKSILPSAWIPRTVYLLDHPPLDERGKWSIPTATQTGREWKRGE